MSTHLVGQRVKRLEDPDLLSGRGQFVDDLNLPGLLHVAFLRSPLAHARIRSIDTSEAASLTGVHAVWTARELPQNMEGRRLLMQVPNPAIRHPITQQPLASDEVCFVGEAVAAVVADSRHQAEDACERIVANFEELPVSANCEFATKPGAAPAHAGLQDNVAAQFTLDYGDVDAAFRNASHVFQDRYFQHRGTANPMEGRGVVAIYDTISQSFTVWSATQSPFIIRRMLVDMFEVEENKIRVIAPKDVGGGFGPKGMSYPEEVVVLALARALGHPIKWIEDRREHFLTTTQERDQIWNVSIAVDPAGKILGLKGRLTHDAGAFMPWGIITPYISTTTIAGPYVVPTFKFDTTAVFTNKPATTPLRGAGRPQAVFAMERTLDLVARELNIDRAEIRRRNLIPAEAMPYKMGLIFRDGAPVIYDSGDYPKCQSMALKAANYDDFKRRQLLAREAGRYIGIGIANAVEGTGLGPFEGAMVKVAPSGRILLQTGASPQGQAHHTTLAQLCAEELNIPIEHVDVVTGDTNAVSLGVGTFASRIAVNAGSSVKLATKTVRGKLIKLAAAILQVEEGDLEMHNGEIKITGAQGDTVTFSDLAKMMNGVPGFKLPEGIEAGLEATAYFQPSQAAYANGCHIAEVEVDPETGAVAIQRYIVAHDCGNLINPMIVDGQVQGGVAHGVGNALLEHLYYDVNANPLTTTFAEYLLPTAELVPDVEIIHLETPTPNNPLGVKGAGEGGTLPAAAVIAAAIDDALSPFGVRFSDSPILPQQIVAAIAES
ncbi:MAG: Caffeine dehydrogenase subunit alpha [Alphaproteobacteria bacterium MarineAlpha4_Bin2]|nr:MAG: Caffeine dehydrogenase subunit alpha [Alphaproteobacteria bacterium MarineAlpha4_Bin2]